MPDVSALLDKYTELVAELRETPASERDGVDWALLSAYEEIVEDLKHA